MAKKLAPLVIPAVIDTSGIDKGVNSIRNKLSRVRGQGAGGGGIGGGGGGFSSGITPYGLPIGGGSATAAAMAAAFGAAAGSRTRQGVGSFAKGKGNVWEGQTRGFRNWAENKGMTTQSALAFKNMRARNREFTGEAFGPFTPFTPMFEFQDAAEQAQKKYFDTMQRQQNLRRAVGRGMIKRDIYDNYIKDRTTGREKSATALATGYATLRTLEALSPRGIQSTLGDLKPFQSRAAGQYDIAQGMRNRAMTATQGNLTMGQQFLLGAGTEAGGGVTRTEQMGSNLYEGLGAAAGYAGTLLERGLSSSVGAMEGVLQRNVGMTNAITAPFNWLRRVLN